MQMKGQITLKKETNENEMSNDEMECGNGGEDKIVSTNGGNKLSMQLLVIISKYILFVIIGIYLH